MISPLGASSAGFFFGDIVTVASLVNGVYHVRCSCELVWMECGPLETWTVIVGTGERALEACGVVCTSLLRSTFLEAWFPGRRELAPVDAAWHGVGRGASPYWWSRCWLLLLLLLCPACFWLYRWSRGCCTWCGRWGGDILYGTLDCALVALGAVSIKA